MAVVYYKPGDNVPHVLARAHTVVLCPLDVVVFCPRARATCKHCDIVSGSVCRESGRAMTNCKSRWPVINGQRLAATSGQLMIPLSAP